MSWFTDAFTGGAGKLIGQVGGIIDDLNLSGEEKQQFKLQMEALVQKRDSETEETLRIEIGAKERIMLAEMASGDRFTSRLRPTAGYAGLAFIALNHVVMPIIALLVSIWNYTGRAEDFVFVNPDLSLPTEFWVVWGGLMGIYSIGRSAEKVGIRNRVTSAITGSLLLKD